MKKPPLVITAILLFFAFTSSAQDKIYMSNGEKFTGKVTEIDSRNIKFTRTDIPASPTYTWALKQVDSVVYENGMVDNMHTLAPRRTRNVNIPQLNSFTVNVLAFRHLTFAPAYERRLKNGKLGFYIPLYFGFETNKIAGVGTFIPFEGVQYEDYSLYVKRSFNMALGFNPRAYLFKHRVVRMYAGPEVDMGFTLYRYDKQPDYYGNNYPVVKGDMHLAGTFNSMGVLGLSIYPRDRFVISLHGGAGAGALFGANRNTELVGTWQLGLDIGTNF